MAQPVITERDRTLGFLICDVARLMRRNFNRKARDIGLTQAQWQAMGQISRNPGINHTCLADLLEIQPITLTRQLDRIQAAAWIEKRPNPNDRRAMRLFLTPKGERMLAQLRELGAQMLGTGLAGVSDEARDTMIEALSCVKEQVVDAQIGPRHNGAEQAREDLEPGKRNT